MEVLAALSFEDAEFSEHMAADAEGRFPQCY